MPSPFPGMDPYLEDPAFWPDFHRTFIGALREAILDRLPPDYDARIDEQLRLIDYTEEMRSVYPDVTVLHHHHASPGAPQPQPAKPNSGVSVLEPVTVPAPATAEVRDVWIEVRHLPDRSVVTVIEVMSPTNERGDGYLEYLAKRRAILQRPLNLVEIDLLRGGQRLNYGPKMPKKDYCTLVSRRDRPHSVDVHAWSLRDRLPGIPIPLRPSDGDLAVDLQDVFAVSYERGKYERVLKYGGKPPVGLADDDEPWARGVASNARR